MSNLKLIIVREFIARVRNRTFIVMTFLSPLLVLGMGGLIFWLTGVNNDEVHEVAFFDETGMFVSDFVDSKHINYINYSHLPLNDAKDSVVIKDLYGLLYIPKTDEISRLEEGVQLFTDESPNITILSEIEGVLEGKLTDRNFKSQGFDIHTIEKAKAKVNIQIENFSGEKTSKLSNYVKMIFGGAAGYLLMMFIIIYGNMVMRSVIEEKTNRIIEIIISSVKPFQLMLGKILGTSFAGILQFFIWVFLGTVILIVATNVIDAPVTPVGMTASMPETAGANLDEAQLILQDILKLPLGTLVVSFFVYFIGGYFLYSSIYAAIGAAVDNETDSQQFIFPIIMPLMLGIYVGFFTVIENPHGTVATIFSMIPLTSPIVMLMRIPFGVPWWQIAISLMLLIATINLIIWLAAKIYRVGILMYGKKTTYKELFKWMRY